MLQCFKQRLFTATPKAGREHGIGGGGVLVMSKHTFHRCLVELCLVELCLVELVELCLVELCLVELCLVELCLVELC